MERKTNKKGELEIVSGNVRAVIRQDEDSWFNPRVDHDNLGTIVCWHRRYDLGDRHSYRDRDHFFKTLWDQYATPTEQKRLARDLWSALSAERKETLRWKLKAAADSYFNLKDKRDAVFSLLIDEIGIAEYGAPQEVIMLPLYLFDHGGLAISTGAFGCSWDSGQVGFIYCTLTKARQWLGTDHYDKIIRRLKSEVKEYDMYLRGDVYRIDVYKGDCGCDQCDERIDGSCGLLGIESAIEATEEIVGNV